MRHGDNSRIWWILMLGLGLAANACGSQQTGGSPASDEQRQCAAAGATWRSFSDTCKDLCMHQVPRRIQEDVVCGPGTTEGCDCGPSKCWELGACIDADNLGVDHGNPA